MKTKDAVERLNNDPSDGKAREALRAKLGPHTALRLDGAGKILLAETEAALQHCEETGEPAPDAITFAEWEQRSAKQREACPVTRRALLGGKLRIERPHGLPAISADWGPVSVERREVAAFLAETQGLTDPVAAITALSLGTLTNEWATAHRDWQDLCALKKPTAQQRALIERVRARLWFEAPAARPIEQPPAVELGAATQVSVTQNAAPSAPGAPLVVGLYAEADARFWQDMKTQGFLLQRQGLAKFWGCSEVPAGRSSRTYLTEQVARAAVVVVLVSADFLADAELNDLALMAMGRRQSVWPIVVRPCMLDLSPLGRLSGVQLGQGATMLDVVQNLRQRLVPR